MYNRVCNRVCAGPGSSALPLVVTMLRREMILCTG